VDLFDIFFWKSGRKFALSFPLQILGDLSPPVSRDLRPCSETPERISIQLGRYNYKYSSERGSDRRPSSEVNYLLDRDIVSFCSSCRHHRSSPPVSGTSIATDWRDILLSNRLNEIARWSDESCAPFVIATKMRTLYFADEPKCGQNRQLTRDNLNKCKQILKPNEGELMLRLLSCTNLSLYFT